VTDGVADDRAEEPTGGGSRRGGSAITIGYGYDGHTRDMADESPAAVQLLGGNHAGGAG